MKKVIKQVGSTTNVATTYMLDKTDKVSVELKKGMEERVNPLRTSFAKRYPILFSLLAAFGIATTYYGFEKILSQYEFLNRHPELILLLGVSILALTGSLYKKNFEV